MARRSNKRSKATCYGPTHMLSHVTAGGAELGKWASKQVMPLAWPIHQGQTGASTATHFVIRSASWPSLKWLASLSAPWMDLGNWSCIARSRARALRSALFAAWKSLSDNESILVIKRI
eukprot:scaffold112638_cov27-Tisochrysis_lutea.AAC.2